MITPYEAAMVAQDEVRHLEKDVCRKEQAKG